MHLAIDAHHGPADKSRLFQHQVDKLFIAQLVWFQAELFEARAPEVEHLRSRFPLEQLLYLGLVKGIFKEVPLAYFHILLRKKLLRLPAGISLYPAIKINFHGFLPLFYL